MTDRAIAAARGNAGLQDLLFQAVLADRATGEAAVKALEDYLGGGDLPARGALRDTLERLVVDKLLEAVDRGRAYAAAALRHCSACRCRSRSGRNSPPTNGLGRPDRLLGFGLWERLPDIADPHADAAGPNAIAAVRLPSPPDEEAKRAIASLLPDLFTAWGGPDRSGKSTATDIELTRLALDCGNLDVLAVTGLFAIRGLEQAFAYREASSIAMDALDALEHGGRVPETQFLRAAAEVFDRVGEPEALRRVYAGAAAVVADDPALPAADRLARAQLRMRYGAYLQQQGGPDTALLELQAAAAVFEALGDRRERAVTLGDIARIMTGKGEVEAALALHQEQLQIFEALGDRRERAVTLGDIARIMTGKGEVEAALALHQEQARRPSRRWAIGASGR